MGTCDLTDLFSLSGRTTLVDQAADIYGPSVLNDLG